MIVTLVVPILSTVVVASGATTAADNVILPVTTLSLSELVQKLDNERPVSESARKESNTNHWYDDAVAEILRRRDVAAVPLLLTRVNDETVVRNSNGDVLWGCRYDSPVQVKYKVRFVLLRLLHPMDFNAMVGDASAHAVNVERAKDYLEANRGVIAGRLR